MPFKLEGTDRIDNTPLHKALREALANALIHADYYDQRGLVIQKWPDKIRIANPDAFRINVQEALVGGVSDPRNESLIKMFNLINVGERAGSGLPRIRTVWQKQGWQEPEAENVQSQQNQRFIVGLYRPVVVLRCKVPRRISSGTLKKRIAMYFCNALFGLMLLGFQNHFPVSGKMILLTKKKITIDTPPFKTVVPML